MRQAILKKLNTIVVKVGTSVIASHQNHLDKNRIKNISFQISKLMNNGKKVALVSSGAIGAGMGLLGIKNRPAGLPLLQACAALGQPYLMKAYDEFFKKKGILTSQVLLTRQDLIDRKRYLNAKNTILTLLDKKIVPIINENDTVSVEEIKFGDNDTLSSLVANLIEADLLILLSDVDGFVKADLGTDKQQIIKIVREIAPEIKNLAFGTKRESSSGGMITKLAAAEIAASSGIPLIIANGKKDDILLKVLDGEDIGTLFLPKVIKLTAKKKWLAFACKPKGSIIVDSGARHALIDRHKSLLSSGIVGKGGDFKAGDLISILDEKKREFARGLSNYSSVDLEKIKGRRTSEIQAILGKKFYDEVVHRDNLVIL